MGVYKLVNLLSHVLLASDANDQDYDDQDWWCPGEWLGQWIYFQPLKESTQSSKHGKQHRAFHIFVLLCHERFFHELT